MAVLQLLAAFACLGSRAQEAGKAVLADVLLESPLTDGDSAPVAAGGDQQSGRFVFGRRAQAPFPSVPSPRRDCHPED